MEGKEKSSRSSLKTHPIFNNNQVWKLKLRENCYRRVREDRKRLIWETRVVPNSFSSEGLIKSAFEDIVSDELQKLKNVSCEENKKMKIPLDTPEIDDVLWEYDGLHAAYQGDCEEILLEMQRIFYEDMKTESTTFKGPENYVETWDNEEDEYLSHAVYEHMQLNEKQLEEVIWCPVCKRGQLQENARLIYCTVCKIQLKKDDKVDLVLARVRLAEVHSEHLDRGCKLKPKFSMETRFGLTALYISCTGCCTFDIVM